MMTEKKVLIVMRASNAVKTHAPTHERVTARQVLDHAEIFNAASL
jgi:hypothetical protein